MNRKIPPLGLVIVTLLLVLVVVPVLAGPPPTPNPGRQKKEIAQLREQFKKFDHPGQGYEHGKSSERPARVRNLSLVGSNNFEGTGFNSDVWAHDRYAYVGTWGIWTPDGELCPNLGTKVASISDSSNPDWVNTLPAPPGTQTNDVKVAHVNTEHFTGDLLAVSNEDCRAADGGRGFELWDVTDPTAAEFLGRFGPAAATDTEPFLVEIGFGVHNVFIFEQGERAYVAAIVDFGEVFQDFFGAPLVGDLRIVDVTDPRNPVQVGDWGIAKDLGQGPAFNLGPHDVWVENDIAYLSHWDGGLILLDVSDPSDPRFISQTLYDPSEEGNTHVAVPAQGGNLVIVGDEDFEPDPWGFLRIFDTQDASDPVQIATFATENSLNAPPPIGDFTAHNIVVRGSSVYASWYTDGILVIDISQPAAPREIASFVPEPVPDPFGILPTVAEMWGIYVQNDLILGSDMNAGLYVLKHVP